ncbi:sporulation control protein Spo0M [Photobacterium jeanii]|uniref:Sporulation control protein Spo0M n=1 Tax=Photobacterium jeanii TaxID=858640 RepID=A0A178K5U0_9GAMM|nr:sporulation protein [Photobacterium jeanii]OAN12631.1 sporulation control protein Spo0M [Photobacterium jeanii]PST86589.1 sporulation control protein Spo0M [Photobacterium jeanii]
MSLFRKSLASFGIGAAKVDTILPQDALIPGQPLPVEIEVQGGATEQQIDNIHLTLCCRYLEEVASGRGESEQRTEKVPQVCRLAHWSLPETFVIGIDEQRQFTATLDLPFNTPVTIGDAQVWLDTSLDIARAIDPKDKDTLTVRPEPLMDGVFTALEHAGLRIRQVECEAAKGFALPFVQEFEFVPVSGPFHGRWRELEVVAYRDEESLQLWFEVDRRQKGLTGMLSSFLGRGELKRQLTISADLSPEEAGDEVLTFLDRTT